VHEQKLINQDNAKHLVQGYAKSCLGNERHLIAYISENRRRNSILPTLIAGSAAWRRIRGLHVFSILGVSACGKALIYWAGASTRAIWSKMLLSPPSGSVGVTLPKSAMDAMGLCGHFVH
jgi:hypothetical protein